jgi:hypothetical protein
MLKKLIAVLMIIGFSNFVNAQEVAKDQWVAAMKTALPAAFCNSAQYFRQCFDVTAVECEEAAASTTRICLTELNSQIPNILIQPKEGTLWGTKVGECAGNAYETSLIKKRISNAECNDVSNWQ